MHCRVRMQIAISLCTAQCKCTFYATQYAPGVQCTVRMHAHTDTKSTSSDGTGAGQKEILKNKNTTKGT